MNNGTLEHAIYLEECRQMDEADRLIARMAWADMAEEEELSPIIQCRGCNTPMVDVSEGYCEDCRDTANAGYYSERIYEVDDIPF